VRWYLLVWALWPFVIAAAVLAAMSAGVYLSDGLAYLALMSCGLAIPAV
jgi:hypothetical protein